MIFLQGEDTPSFRVKGLRLWVEGLGFSSVPGASKILTPKP